MSCARPTTATLAALVVLLSGCGDTPVLPETVTSLAATPAVVTALPGDTVRIRFTDDRGRPVQPTVLGASSTAATIDAAGLVTAVTPGSAVVTVSIVSGGRTVTAAVPVRVLGLTLDPRRVVLTIGGVTAVRPLFAGDSAVYGTLAWSSSDSTVARVGADGRVSGVQPGVARITTVASVDARLRAAVDVAVLCIGLVQTITASPATLALPVGGTQQITATIALCPCAPATESRAALYASSDTGVVTVSAAGLVTARRAGSATITVAAAAAPTVAVSVRVTVGSPAP